MRIIKWLKSLLRQQQSIFHIGEKRMNEQEIKNQKAKYFFFRTTSFINDNEIMEMWDRLSRLLPMKKPTIIIIEMKDGIMNEREEKFLRNFGVVLKLSDV